jgi:uncharacterized repeat protein (TIGR01451 family)
MSIFSTRQRRVRWMVAVGAVALACAAPVTAAPTTTTSEQECLNPCADLIVSMEATNEIVGAGERFSYHLTVENDGPTNAVTVTLTDRLPDAVTFVSAESDGMQCTEAGGVVTCSAAELALDGAAEVEVVVQAPTETGTLVTDAEVVSETPEFDASSNAISLETQVGTGADLMLFTYAEDAAPGAPAHFHVSVVNDGPQTAQGVVVEDLLPQGVDLVSATPDSGACAPPTGRRLTCSLGTVPAFAGVEVEIVLSAISEGALINVAAVSATAPVDRDLGNNRDRQAALIGSPPVADLAVSMDAANEIVGAGERFSYLLLVENEGPATAHAVTLTDELPDRVTYVSAEGLPCSEAGGIVTCTAADLEVGGSAEVELLVEAPDEVGSLVNEATVAAATEDFDLSNNSSLLETRLGTGADVNLAAYGDDTVPGEPAHFFVSVWNDGPQTAHEIVVTDTLPAGVELLSATPNAGSCSPPTGRELMCSIGTLAALGEVEVEIEIVVSGSAEGVLTNIASVTAAVPTDIDLNNNRDTHTLIVGDPLLADVAVYKDAPAAAAPGNDLVYDVSVQNVGPEEAHEVRLSDPLPANVAFVAATMDTGRTCTFAGGIVSCDVGDLGTDEIVDIALTVRPESEGRVVNTAEVSAFAGPADPVPESNTSTVETRIGLPPVAGEEAFAVDEDKTLNVAAPGVLGNDESAAAATLTAVLVDDVAYGHLTLRPNGSFTYRPERNFSGSDSFGYLASDDGLPSKLATVTIAVNPVNDPPTAVKDTYQGQEDVTLTVSAAKGLLRNDIDVEGSALTATLISSPANGTVTLGADGSFTFVPRADFHGADSFIYRAHDGELESNPAAVTIRLAEAPAPPPPVLPPPPPPVSPRHLLTVAKSGTGTGTITSTPGIDCGIDCGEEYDAGTSVTLLATASRGSRFVSWGGACSGAAAGCTVTMDAAKAVTATFRKIVVKPKVVKRTLCFRKRTIKVPKSQVAKYKKKGAKLGACKKPRRKR